MEDEHTRTRKGAFQNYAFGANHLNVRKQYKDSLGRHPKTPRDLKCKGCIKALHKIYKYLKGVKLGILWVQMKRKI